MFFQEMLENTVTDVWKHVPSNPDQNHFSPSITQHSMFDLVLAVLPLFFRFARFLGILTLESFTAAALGLSVGAAAPNADAAVAIGPAVMLVWIIFGGYYCNSENIPRCGHCAMQRAAIATAATAAHVLWLAAITVAASLGAGCACSMFVSCAWFNTAY
jgi:hypothetical protein